MIRVEIHETIARPIEDVFERLVDIPGYAEWMPDDGLFVTCSKDSDGPVGVGTTYTDETRLGTARGEIAEFERPNRVVFHYTARLLGMTALEGWPGYELERDGEGGTRVHHLAEARAYGPFKLARPLLRRLARRERQRTVNALKESLESTSPEDAPAFLIGRETGDHLEVVVRGGAPPEVTDFWDGNWVGVEVRVRAGGFRGTYRASFRTTELRDFRAALEGLKEDLGGEARFETLEEQLAVVIRGDGRGHFVAECEARDEAGTGNVLEFSLGFDQTEIPGMVRGLSGILELHPVRGARDAEDQILGEA